MSKVAIEDIARYTVLRLTQNGNSICPLKLQKVLYYMQAWYMVYFNRENTLFDDVPEAWVNGPVYRSVYNAYKDVGMYDQIPLAKVGSSEESLEKDTEALYRKMGLGKEETEFIESVYKHYGSMSHDQLVFLTHSQRPWNEARKGLEPFEYSDREISLDTMYRYYTGIKSNA